MCEWTVSRHQIAVEEEPGVSLTGIGPRKSACIYIIGGWESTLNPTWGRRPMRSVSDSAIWRESRILPGYMGISSYRLEPKLQKSSRDALIEAAGEFGGGRLRPFTEVVCLIARDGDMDASALGPKRPVLRLSGRLIGRI